PVSIAYDATRIFWANHGANEVFAIPKTLGVGATLVSSSLINDPLGVAVVPPKVLWMNAGGITYSCPLATIPCGPTTEIGYALPNPRDFTSTPDQSVYTYAQDGDGGSAIVFAGYPENVAGNVQGVTGQSTPVQRAYLDGERGSRRRVVERVDDECARRQPS